jgi:hypothetical protein
VLSADVRGIGVSHQSDTQRVVNRAELSWLVQSPDVAVGLLGIVSYTPMFAAV